ncbi:MAG: 50S ribosomal protein L9 [Candidatus Lindowbacteria bacterium]|nr:50S ribosomal protein L9 [Candidatus Lindowbacteria bacterium]
MKVILREDIKRLGKAGEVVEVKDGYGRNYLIPRNLAVSADAGHLRQLEHERKVLREKKDKGLKDAKNLAEKISAASCTIPVQVGEEEKIFGSVTAMDIAECLKKEGIEIDKKIIQLEEPIKSVGVFTVPVRIVPEVEAKLKVWVVKAD